MIALSPTAVPVARFGDSEPEGLGIGEGSADSHEAQGERVVPGKVLSDLGRETSPSNSSVNCD